MPKSSNHTKSASENTGKWRPRDPETLARSKRSLERQRQNHRTLDLLDDGDGDVGANGDGTVVQHDNPLKDSLSPRALYARTNRALPQQMYDAMMAVKSSSSKRVPFKRKHRKRQASDMIVYRKDPDDDDDDDDDITSGTVNIVPLDSEHRIRINLTIASDDDRAGSPMYAVSLSLPSADQVEPAAAKVAAVVHPVDSVPPSRSSGTECDCFCPCLEQDEDPEGSGTVTANIVPTTPSTFDPNDDNTTSNTIWATASSTTEPPEQTVDVVSCPPPVLLFCDTGKSPIFHLTIRTRRKQRQRRRRPTT